MIPVGEKEFELVGMFADIFNNLAGFMNFTYSVIKPPDGQWGAIQSDNSWNGMVKLLQNEEIDMAPASFTVTVARSRVLTFAIPIAQIYHSLFIQNPSASYNAMAYIEPLHYLSWIILLVFILLVPPFLFFTTRFVPLLVLYIFNCDLHSV